MARRITASHLIAYQDGGHRHLPDGVIVTEGNQIIRVGPTGSYTGAADETLDTIGKLVTPRLFSARERAGAGYGMRPRFTTTRRRDDGGTIGGDLYGSVLDAARSGDDRNRGS
jgi:hypothetical protein